MNESSESAQRPKRAVVLGKTTIRADERAVLETLGRALAIRGIELAAPNGEGTPEIVAHAYNTAGGPNFIPLTKANADDIIAGANEIIAFTDIKYMKHLDERVPGWKDRGWLVLHNRKALLQVADYLKQIFADIGVPLEDGGTA